MSIRDLTAFVGYAAGLPRFLGRPVACSESRRWLEEALQRREASFLRIVEQAVLRNPRSPYRLLLAHAGIEFGDLVRLVRGEGLDGALGHLYDAGVRVAYEEFKGHRPLERPGLTLAVQSEDFDNPVLGLAVGWTTAGSRGPARRVLLSRALLEYRVAYDCLTAAAHGGLEGRPLAIWRSAPPALTGLNSLLTYAKRGIRAEHWFAQNRFAPSRGVTREFLLTAYTILASRVWGIPLPMPEPTPAAEAVRVARWLAAKRSAGTPALLDAPASSCVRVCLAARDHGLDISGTAFRVAGEPFTNGKARVVRESGCRALVHYGMVDIGRIGIPCAAAQAVDDVHFLSDRLAVIQRDRDVNFGLGHVGAFHFTTLHERSPKIMINVESDDYGVLEERDCGCAIGEVGLSQHLHSIRSYEKLTSEGMHFLGDELIVALEETLPARFGGAPSDYQLVEEEVDGLPRVNLVISPRVGSVGERQVAECLLDALRKGPAYRGLMAGAWEQAQTLRVVRREPYTTASAKILPLHVLKS